MNEIVFILGAGASAQAGAPLMYDFIDTAQNLYSLGQTPKNKEDFERVFKAIAALQRVHSKADFDLINIESIFTALEMAEMLGKLPEHDADEIPLIIASLKKLIMITLEQTVIFPRTEGVISPPKPYNKLVSLIKDLKGRAEPNQKVSIITFNYDIALDYALSFNSIHSNYGYNDDRPDGLSILKLHGSLNWAEEEENGTVFTLNIEEYARMMNTSFSRDIKFNISTNLKEACKRKGKKVKNEPVIVPPTFNKGNYQKLIAPVWRNAASTLEKADQIYVIGYSMPQTDGLFPLLYALGTEGDTRLKKFTVFDPNPDVENRFKSILGRSALQRFNFIPEKFDPSISTIRSYYKFTPRD